MGKEGQAAMEFILTYGWAILMVMIVFAGLSYFGLLNPKDFLQIADKCQTNDHKFICQKMWAENDVSQRYTINGDYLFWLEYTGGDRVTIVDQTLDRDYEPTLAGTCEAGTSGGLIMVNPYVTGVCAGEVGLSESGSTCDGAPTPKNVRTRSLDGAKTATLYSTTEFDVDVARPFDSKRVYNSTVLSGNTNLGGPYAPFHLILPCDEFVEEGKVEATMSFWYYDHETTLTKKVVVEATGNVR